MDDQTIRLNCLQIAQYRTGPNEDVLEVAERVFQWIDRDLARFQCVGMADAKLQPGEDLIESAERLYRWVVQADRPPPAGAGKQNGAPPTPDDGERTSQPE